MKTGKIKKIPWKWTKKNHKKAKNTKSNRAPKIEK